MNLDDLKAMYDLTGRTYIVTGGAGVLGGEVARAVAGCGAHVVLLDLDVAPAEGLIERVRPDGPCLYAIGGDVLDRNSLRQATARVSERFGRIDGLVNAAGGNKPAATTGPEQSFLDLPEDALRYVFDLNLIGTILPCQVVGRQMVEQGAGVILNFSSMNSFRPLTRVVAYSAAKAGINNFTQWLAVHMAQTYSPNIRVNAVAPGFFMGQQNRFLLTDRETGELTPRGRTIIEHTPMRRFGVPADLLGTILWLLSPASAFVTGIVVPVDGGFSAFSGV
jgi:NAD(P)-dependent dehydrogenase (short-subunit alcohol dehydrogenase family)